MLTKDATDANKMRGNPTSFIASCMVQGLPRPIPYGVLLTKRDNTFANKFGAEVGLVGKTGKDDSSKTLLKLLNDQGILTDLIKESEDVQTNVDTGLVVSHSAQNIQIVAGSANQSLSLEDIDLDNEIFDQVQAVYLGGCFKQKKLWPHYPEIFKNLNKRKP